MGKSNKSKWIIGLSGTAMSAFVISQIDLKNQGNEGNQAGESKSIITKSMSFEEKEFVQLDWSNYNINGVPFTGGAVQSDRQTRRS